MYDNIELVYMIHKECDCDINDNLSLYIDLFNALLKKHGHNNEIVFAFTTHIHCKWLPIEV